MRLNALAPLALIALPLVIMATACVPRSAPPTPVPAPGPAPSPRSTPTPPPPAPVHAAWEDNPQTPGDWVYAGGVATFGLPGQPRLEFRCAGGTVRIAVLGASADLLTFRTETTQRSAPANGGVATFSARDPLLDAIAFSKGRFAVEAGNAALYPPAYPEISRVIEDCR
jgi:hypothetical protein